MKGRSTKDLGYFFRSKGFLVGMIIILTIVIVILLYLISMPDSTLQAAPSADGYDYNFSTPRKTLESVIHAADHYDLEYFRKGFNRPLSENPIELLYIFSRMSAAEEIEFIIDENDAAVRLSYDLSPREIRQPTITLVEFEKVGDIWKIIPENLIYRLEKNNRIKNKVVPRRSFISLGENTTEVMLSIPVVFNESVTIYEKVPKDVAKDISELEIGFPFEVVESDPQFSYSLTPVSLDSADIQKEDHGVLHEFAEIGGSILLLVIHPPGPMISKAMIKEWMVDPGAAIKKYNEIDKIFMIPVPDSITPGSDEISLSYVIDKDIGLVEGQATAFSYVSTLSNNYEPADFQMDCTKDSQCLGDLVCLDEICVCKDDDLYSSGSCIPKDMVMTLAEETIDDYQYDMVEREEIDDVKESAKSYFPIEMPSLDIDDNKDCGLCRCGLYMTPVLVWNSHFREVEDETVEFTLDTASLIEEDRMKSGCEDLIVSDSAGSIVSYWIEQGCGTEHTIIHAKVPVIEPGENNFLMVTYGDHSTPSGSDPGDLFIFFEDFENEISAWTLGDRYFVVPEQDDDALVISGRGTQGTYSYWKSWSYAHTDYLVSSDQGFRLTAKADVADADWSEFFTGLRVDDKNAFIYGIHYDPRGPREALEVIISRDLSLGRNGPVGIGPARSVILNSSGYGEHRLQSTFSPGNAKVSVYMDGTGYGSWDLGWDDDNLSLYLGANARSDGNLIDVSFEYIFLSDFLSSAMVIPSDADYVCDGSGRYVCDQQEPCNI